MVSDVYGKTLATLLALLLVWIIISLGLMLSYNFIVPIVFPGMINDGALAPGPSLVELRPMIRPSIDFGACLVLVGIIELTIFLSNTVSTTVADWVRGNSREQDDE